MGKRFRLKKEAAPFFKEKHATAIYTMDTWEGLQVDSNALEEVEEAYISYGIEVSKNGSSLGGWGKDKGANFHMTINFPSMKMREYDEFHKGHTLRKLMDKIQQQINWFYEDFTHGGDGEI